MTQLVILILGILLTPLPRVFSSGHLPGFINQVMVENMEIRGTDLVAMTTDNFRQCLRLCWLYSDCTTLSYYSRKQRCRLTAHNPTNLNTILVANQEAITVDLRRASVDEPRLHGCDSRPCGTNELCVPVVDPATYRCLSLGYDKCPSAPPIVHHATHTMDGLSKITYTCNDGFVTSGTNDVTTCDRTTGLWSPVDVACTFTDCGSPPAVGGSNTVGSDTSYNAKIQYNCYDGYVSLSEPMYITCQSDSQWSTPPLPCTLKTCPTPAGVNNGSFRILDRVYTSVPPGVDTQELRLSYGSTVVHFCTEGYQSQTTPEFRSECQQDRTWESPSSFRCDLVDCGRPPAIANTWNTFNATTFQARAGYVCVEGFESLNGIPKRELICNATGSWSGPEVTCQMVDCGTPPNEENATAVYSSTSYLSKANYTCDAPTVMFQLNFQSRVCQANGQWSDEDVPCIPCGSPPEAPHATVNLTRNALLDSQYIALYTCHHGYSARVNDLSLTSKSCSAGAWVNNVDVVCLPITCDDPPSLSNTSVSTNGTTLHSIAIYSCADGFVPGQNATTKTFTCEMRGWTEKDNTLTFECRKTGCGSPPQINNALSQIMVNGSDDTQIVSYSCLPGYALASNSNTKQCLSDGWENTNVTCVKTVCGPPKQISNATWDLDDAFAVWTQTAVYTCSDGYSPGQYRVECVDGHWTDYETVNCPLVDCGQPPEVTNSTVMSINGTLYNHTILYKCEDGRNWTVICQENGNWSSTHNTTCQTQKDCGPPPKYPNSVLSSSVDITQDNFINYMCQPGYVLKNTLTTAKLTCTMGEWIGEIASKNEICEPIDCGPPPVFPNTIFTHNSTQINSTVLYSCSPGYFPVSYVNQRKTCNGSGAWTGNEDLKCYASECGQVPVVDNATFKSSEYITIGSEVSYSCDSGFELSENRSRIYCVSFGVWGSNDIECLELTCGSVRTAEHSNYFLKFLDGNLQATYYCEDGYHARGTHDVLTCLSTGVWNGTLIDCTLSICNIPPEVENALWRLEVSEVGSRVIYSCKEGYQHWWFYSRTCTMRGAWSKERVECKIIDCGKPRDISNAIPSYNHTTYSHEVNYTCEPGYRLTHSGILMCTHTGYWSTDLVECVDEGTRYCPVPQSEQFSDVFYHSLIEIVNYIPIATYVCYHGYTRYVESYKKTCGRITNYEWLSVGPEVLCSPVTCSDPPNAPANALSTQNGSTFGSLISYNCDSGFQMVGFGGIMCQENGKWGKDLTECYEFGSRQFCSDPPEVANAAVRVVSYQNTAVYSCLPGYELNSDMNHVTCDTDTGQWKGQEKINCQPRDCGAPVNISDASLTVYETTFRNWAVYECLSEFNQTGPYISKCEESGQWSKHRTSPCERAVEIQPNITCPLFVPGIPNTDLAFINDGDNFVMVYSCKPGYRAPGNDVFEIRCLDTGEWEDSSRVVCEPGGECKNSPNIANATQTSFNEMLLQRGQGEVGFLAGFQCNTGFVVNGTNLQDNITSIEIRCSVPGGWEELPSCKVVDCGNVLPFNETTAMVSRLDGTTYGSRAVLACRDPFMGNESVSVCQESGTWSQVEMVCKDSYCLSPPPVEGGKLVLLSTKRFEQSIVTSWTMDCDENHQLLANENETVTCLFDKDIVQEIWDEAGITDGCVRTKWVDQASPFSYAVPYHKQHHFNTMSTCVYGKYAKMTDEYSTSEITIRYRSKGVFPIRLAIRTSKRIAEMSYQTPSQSFGILVQEKNVKISKGQLIMVCMDFFLFNSTFTVSLDGSYFGSIAFPMANNETSDKFELSWAKAFIIKPNFWIESLNITYSTL